MSVIQPPTRARGGPLALDRTLAALASLRRRRVLLLLREGPQRAGDIAAQFPRVTRAAIAKHMRVLEDAQLVTVRQSGRERWYALQAEPLREVGRLVEHYRDFWDGKL